MKVAVMQPYLFPYLGYYQLAHCADVFVLYDDVTFIKGGYINRNRVLVNGQPQRVTIPVPGASSNKKINELCFSGDIRKALTTIKQAYAKAPYFQDVFPMVEGVLTHPDRDIPSICRLGIEKVFGYLGLDTRLMLSSNLEYDRALPAADRLVEICQMLGANDYVNSIGGQALYSKAHFEGRGCNLSFISMDEVSYSQGQDEFVPNLSIIDALMWCDRATVIQLLDKYQLV